MTNKTREQLIQEMSMIQEQLESLDNKYEDKLVSSGCFFYGSLRGIENAHDLREFLKENSDWIREMMGW